ncbi:MAG: hypothetical protein ACI4T9_09005 [Prevotella sp.]
MKKETKVTDIKKGLEAVQKRITVKIDGKEYPCYFTMGAALTFKDLTGRDTTEMDNGLSDFAAYLYACSKSACRREKKEFPFEDVQDFADHIDGEELARLSEAMIDTDDSQKKA